VTTGNERNRQVFVSFSDTKDKFNTTSIARLITLQLLMKRSYYGQEIIEEIEKELSGMWRPSPGMIYPQLRLMEENQWVEGWWDAPDKKSIRHYKITDEGIKYYNRIKNIYHSQLTDSKNIIERVIDVIYKNK